MGIFDCKECSEGEENRTNQLLINESSQSELPPYSRGVKIKIIKKVEPRKEITDSNNNIVKDNSISKNTLMDKKEMNSNIYDRQKIRI